MVQHKYLVKSPYGPLIPWTLEINRVRVTSHKMLGQNHDEPLEDDQEKVLLICLGSFQFLLELLNCFLGWFLHRPVASSFLVSILIFTI